MKVFGPTVSPACVRAAYRRERALRLLATAIVFGAGLAFGLLIA